MPEAGYIQRIMRRVRDKEEGPQEDHIETIVNDNDANKDNKDIDKTFLLVVEKIKQSKAIGNKKRLIRIDESNEELLLYIYPVLKIDATKLINFLLANFFDENPHIKKLIKKTITKL